MIGDENRRGRIYLGKDSYTDAATFRTIYPEVDGWLRTKAKYDPAEFSLRIWAEE